MGIFNDEISSIKLSGNAKVTVWRHINQNGTTATYTNSQPTLGGSLNNQISSYRVFVGAVPAPIATVNLNGTYTIQQKSTGRYLDAHEGNNDSSAMTRPLQNNDTQRWIVSPLGNNVFTIRQKSNGRYLDAHTNGANDYSAVTRTNQNNNTQRWTLTKIGADTYTIQQVSNSRFLDAHGTSARDYSAVTRPNLNRTSQNWIIKVPAASGGAIVSNGTVAVPQTHGVNIDNGTLGGGGGMDMIYQAVTPAEKYLTPVNGAKLSASNPSARGYAGCSTASFSGNKLPLWSLPVGSYVCVKTTANRITEFRLNGYSGTTMNLGYTTWAN